MSELGITGVNIAEPKGLSGNRYKALLHHEYKNKPVQRRIISVKQYKSPPKVITHDQFIFLSDSCTNYRDTFVIWLRNTYRPRFSTKA